MGHRALGHTRGGTRHGVHGLDAADVVVGLVLIEVARQLHDLIAQLGYGNLVLAVAYENLVDGNAAGDLVYTLLKLVQGGAYAVLIALANEDDAGIADDAVDKILLAGSGHTGLYGPHDAHGIAQLLLQRPAGSAGLVFYALVHIALKAAGEEEHSEQRADAQTEDEHEPLAAKKHANEEEEQAHAQEGTQHDGDKRLILLALHIECLPHLGPGLLTLLALGRAFLLLCSL